MGPQLGRASALAQARPRGAVSARPPAPVRAEASFPPRPARPQSQPVRPAVQEARTVGPARCSLSPSARSGLRSSMPPTSARALPFSMVGKHFMRLSAFHATVGHKTCQIGSCSAATA